ncbi:DNA-deoxyinosine glycosylase [Cohnella nanjingensis]|uniref:DNA-deoxyinosine glycosylase n=1 Tax=Cohnella nanjingensis TaxID=1387779 RepID=A0A7X0VHH1_9BACL|nr:DNA-deoxyinosine glycosylase [Cohnella nanjingensis]MBB6673886.1 DNA-deoxyinosine glycosylase [Cohnella nanjingensis]
MDSAIRVHSFPPVVDERSQCLILGSMPGVASLQLHQYYGNARNYLWPILYALHGLPGPDERYEDRLSFARAQGFALWDTIASCVREGSLDSNIRELQPNDIPGLLRAYPAIRVIACNGAKSHGELLRHFGGTPEVRARAVLRLPSTSPIPTPKFRGLEDRLSVWREMLEPYLTTRQDSRND